MVSGLGISKFTLAPPLLRVLRLDGNIAVARRHGSTFFREKHGDMYGWDISPPACCVIARVSQLLTKTVQRCQTLKAQASNGNTIDSRIISNNSRNSRGSSNSRNNRNSGGGGGSRGGSSSIINSSRSSRTCRGDTSVGDIALPMAVAMGHVAAATPATTIVVSQSTPYLLCKSPLRDTHSS